MSDNKETQPKRPPMTHSEITERTFSILAGVSILIVSTAALVKTLKS